MTCEFKDHSVEEMNAKDFDLGPILHRGTFSTVQIVKERSNSKIYAMKSIQKSLPLVQAELEIRSKNASEWLVEFHYLFQEVGVVHLVMEFMGGGTFLNLREAYGGSLHEEMARFYMGELVLAVNVVHSLGYAHRNVCPTNILVDSNGHLKLSGFGCASEIKNGKVTSHLTVDSASYEAPEILRTLGNSTFTYGIQCDFWSVGVIAYEAVAGVHPFRSSCPLSSFKKITSKKTKGCMNLPPILSDDLKDLIEGLLLEQNERLTYDDCVRHSFFNDLIWDGLRNEIAPHIPKPSEEVMQFETPTATAGRSDKTFEKGRKSEALPKKDKTFDTGRKSEALSPVEINVPMTPKTPPMISQTPPNATSTPKTPRTSTVPRAPDAPRTPKMPRTSNAPPPWTPKTPRSQNILRSPPKTPKTPGGKATVQISSADLYELKEEIRRLSEAGSKKDDMILELSVQVKILKHDLKLQQLENQCLMRREETMEDNFAKWYKNNINSLQSRIRELESKVLETSANCPNDEDDLTVRMKEFIETKSLELTILQDKMEEAKLVRDSSITETRETRKKYAETIGELQDALDHALQECSHMEASLHEKNDCNSENEYEI